MQWELVGYELKSGSVDLQAKKDIPQNNTKPEIFKNLKMIFMALAFYN